MLYGNYDVSMILFELIIWYVKVEFKVEGKWTVIFTTAIIDFQLTVRFESTAMSPLRYDHII